MMQTTDSTVGEVIHGRGCCSFLDDRILQDWQTIGSAENLTTDREVAYFLTELYSRKSRSEKHPSCAVCSHCHSPLTWCCTTCLLSAQTAAPPHTPPTSKVPSSPGVSTQQVPPFQSKAPSSPGVSAQLVPPFQKPLPLQAPTVRDSPSQFAHTTDQNHCFHDSGEDDDDGIGAVCSGLESPEVRVETNKSLTDAAVINDETEVTLFCTPKAKADKSVEEKQFNAASHQKKRRNTVFQPHLLRKYNLRRSRTDGNPVTLTFKHKSFQQGVGNPSSSSEDLCVRLDENGKSCQITSKGKTDIVRTSSDLQGKPQTLLTNNVCTENKNDVLVGLNSGCEKSYVCYSEDIRHVGPSSFGKEENQICLEKDFQRTSSTESYASKSKGRPRSKLVSGKYLGVLKKPDGQVQFYSRFECAHCQKMFDRKRDFNNHVLTHYHSKHHICIKCGDGFQTRSELTEHKVDTHSKLSKKPQFMCDQCPAEFKTKGRFHLHKKLHEENKLFSCKTCEFVASSKEALNNHRLTHRKTARVQCEYCGETKRVNNMQRHLLMHRGEKPYNCTQCDAAFRTPFDLKDHVKRRHSKVKPFSCEKCGKGFICSDNLKHHLLVHSGQKPFKCSLCSSSFSRKDYLTKHIRTHTGEKPYKCAECDEVFAYPSSLKVHRKQCHMSTIANSSVICIQKTETAPAVNQFHIPSGIGAETQGFGHFPASTLLPTLPAASNEKQCM